LSPYVISNLKIITGNFNYTLYSLDIFSYLFVDKISLSDITGRSISYEYTLLEINNNYDQPTQKKYFIIQSKKIKSDFGLTEISSGVIYT
jgi:hypothetical protein